VQRIVSSALLVAFVAMTLAPSLFLAHFLARRAYVERELCVQRQMAEGMRTCHGECHLSKQLRALEREAEQGFPVERIDFRTEPAIEQDGFVDQWVVAVLTRSFVSLSAIELSGFPAASEPVPWC